MVTVRLPQPTPHVLVVDDDPIIGMVVSRLLEAEGVSSEVTAGGEAAVRAVAGGTYAAVFMDCEMPGLDGFAATRRIRATARGWRVPIVALTGHASPADRERCLAAGMDDHLAKPIDSSELRRVLEQWVGLVPSRTEEERLLHPQGIERLRAELDPATRERVLELFLAQAPEGIARLRRAADAGDLAALRVEAHRLNGSCLNLGAERMAELCRALERVAAERRVADAPDLIDALAGAFESTRGRLADLLVSS